MHKETADKFNAGNGKFFPLTFFPVIFHIISNRGIVHTDDVVVADGNPVCILAEIINDGLGSIKGFLAVGYNKKRN